MNTLIPDAREELITHIRRTSVVGCLRKINIQLLPRVVLLATVNIASIRNGTCTFSCPIVQEYLEGAALYLGEANNDSAGVGSISGIWVSSDNSSVLAEVRQHAPSYFPNIKAVNIMSTSFGSRAELPTRASTMVRTAFPPPSL